MVIIMNPEATAENIKAVISTIEDAGLEAKVMDGASQRIVGVIGDKRKLGDVTFEAMDGVEKTVAISKSCSRDSTAQGPDITTGVPPIFTPATSTTLERGWNSRLASL